MPLLEDGTFIIDDEIHRFDSGCCKICAHFEGKEKGTCPAYPDKIPDKFAINFEPHTKIEPDQTGSIICSYFEK